MPRWKGESNLSIPYFNKPLVKHIEKFILKGLIKDEKNSFTGAGPT